MGIIENILNGERDAQKLAQYRDTRIKCSEEEICRSLEGNYQPTHLFEFQQVLDLYRFYQQKIAECDQPLQVCLAEFEKKRNNPPRRRVGFLGTLRVLMDNPICFRFMAWI